MGEPMDIDLPLEEQFQILTLRPPPPALINTSPALPPRPRSHPLPPCYRITISPLTPDITSSALFHLMQSHVGPVGHASIHDGEGIIVFRNPDGWKAFQHFNGMLLDERYPIRVVTFPSVARQPNPMIWGSRRDQTPRRPRPIPRPPIPRSIGSASASPRPLCSMVISNPPPRLVGNPPPDPVRSFSPSVRREPPNDVDRADREPHQRSKKRPAPLVDLDFAESDVDVSRGTTRGQRKRIWRATMMRD